MDASSFRFETSSLRSLADAMEQSLWSDLIDRWFPACIDPRSGFYQEFARDWIRGESPFKSVVFQSRMTWVAATLAEAGGARAKEFRVYAEHGLRFLVDRMFDHEDGGFCWAVNELGHPAGNYAKQRHSYGSSFAIYALAAVARALDSSEARDCALQAFGWLERFVHDADRGGYFETTDTQGNVLMSPPNGWFERRGDAIGTRYGLKSQNTHLHLLEAFTELARVAPEPLVLARLREVQEILCVHLFHPDGWLHLFAEPDWTPVPGLVSYGHDIEAAHLLMDAAEVLDGGLDDRTQRAARNLIDYTIARGWDAKQGSFDNLGDPDGTPKDRTKIWWVEAEALLGLARGMELPVVPVEEYAEKLVATWEWIATRQIDREHGGWFEGIGVHGEVLGSGTKGHAWKAAYHDGRAMLFSARALRRLAQ